MVLRKGKPEAKLSTYQNIFKDNYNLGFHQPRKINVGSVWPLTVHLLQLIDYKIH